ncbi:MAG: multicopper oxidase domain-containing protein [Erysipelotrichaceae bacterium]|nr:multicopper oxidase domain-containing protein [Erysipelotrichaceae bacterium]
MRKKWMLGIVLGILIIILVYTVFSMIDFYNDPINTDIGSTDSARKLPIPALLVPSNSDANSSDYYLNVQEGTTNFFNDKSTPTLGYNGSYLGPVLKVARGQEVRMHVTNELQEDTSIHWHGLEVEGTKDGGPHQVISAGATWDPVFTINQPASTLWFHPHVIGSTATQVYYGLAGLIIVEDENSMSLNLPDEYGVNDMPLIIQDRSFSQDGSFVYVDNMMDGATGDYILVNGAITPYLEVNQTKMRFRIVNGANARNFDLRLSDYDEFTQIASDGGLLEKPIVSDSLFISPGERVEIIIDFSKYDEGEKIKLMSDNELVMTFHVGEKTVDDTVIPEVLSVIERLDEDQATNVKTIDLDGMGHMVTLNGRTFDMDRIDDNVTLGDIEIWEITTFRSMMMGSEGHPFHIHGTQFQVLDRNGFEPFENEKGWKDTIFVRSGETVRIIVRFKYKGLFMYHCHILEHEEAGMMGQLEVE